MTDHDPFNEPETAHSRARELMVEDFFWDCIDELAPFGSDEGNDAYYEWRQWREENENAPLVACFSWILMDRLNEYNESLTTDECISNDIKDPRNAFLADEYDIFTLDTTIIASALGQLMDEGKIDNDAKPYVMVAIHRQLHPNITEGDEERIEILNATKRVVEQA